MSDTVKPGVMGSTAAVLAMRFAGLGASFATLMLATRWGGEETGAAYATYLAVTAIVAVLVHTGWPQIAVRLATIYEASSRPAIWRFSTFRMIQVWTVPAVLLAFVPLSPTLRFAAVGALALALARTDEGWLRGSRRPVTAVLTLTVLVPLATLALVVLLHAASRLDERTVVIVACVAFGIAAAGQRLVLGPRISRDRAAEVDPATRRALRTVGLTTMSTSLLRNADLAVAAIALDTNEVATYALVSRLAMTLAQVLFATNAVTAPQIARLWECDDRPLAHHELVRASRYGGGLVALGFLGLLVVAPLVFRLSTLAFTGTALATLAALSAGQFVNASCGPVQAALNVTGGESRAFTVQLATIAVLAICLAIASLTGDMLILGIANAIPVAFSNIALRRSWISHLQGHSP